jgi:hypothetical protein
MEESRGGCSLDRARWFEDPAGQECSLRFSFVLVCFLVRFFVFGGGLERFVALCPPESSGK